MVKLRNSPTNKPCLFSLLLYSVTDCKGGMIFLTQLGGAANRTKAILITFDSQMKILE